MIKPKLENEIIKMIKKGESDSLEFKESLSLKEEIGETTSAFSNTNKGKIIVGVNDFREIIGLDIGKNTIEQLANYLKQNTDNSIYPKISVVKISKKEVIIIDVNEANEKPVFFKGKAYKRVGRSNHKLSASEIRKLAKESGRKVYWDEQICEDAKYSELDRAKVEWYLGQREKHRNISKKLKLPIKIFLENINAIKNGKLTNAGVLFFGKSPLLKIPNAQLRLVRIKGKEIIGIILDRLDCEGTLWEMVEQAENFLKKHINFMGFRTAKSFQREDKFDIPIKALRELIINALIHRDYETNADVRAFIFDDRVEIINPGHFPKGVTPKNPKHEPVNRILSQYMYDIGLIEKYGSGIVNVRALLKENKNKDLDYLLHEIETKAIVYSQSGGLEKVGEKVGENESKVFDLISKNQNITYVELASKIGITEKSVYVNVEKLKQKNMLKRIGPAKGGHWKIIKRNGK